MTETLIKPVDRSTANNRPAHKPNYRPRPGQLIIRGQDGDRVRPALGVSTSPSVVSRPELGNEPVKTPSAKCMTPLPALASPTFMTIQEYYDEHGISTSRHDLPSPPIDVAQGNSLAINSNRRHSTVMSPGTLAASLTLVGLKSCPASPAFSRRGREALQESAGDLIDLGTMLQDARRLLLIETEEQRPVPNAPPPQSPILNPLSPRLLGGLPYSYTHERLKKWGSAYLGNVATADVFVRAVPLVHSTRTADAALENGKDVRAGLMQRGSSRLVRVRVRPWARDCKPFVLQKKFNIAAFPSRPKSASPVGRTIRVGGPRPGRSISVDARRAMFIRSPSLSPEMRDEHLSSPTNAPLAVHVEYALHRLPLLAIIMLSGHVLKGDTIELPLPKPDAWPAVLRWMYLGDVEVSTDMMEDIVHLAGNLD